MGDQLPGANRSDSPSAAEDTSYVAYTGRSSNTMRSKRKDRGNDPFPSVKRQSSIVTTLSKRKPQPTPRFLSQPTSTFFARVISPEAVIYAPPLDGELYEEPTVQQRGDYGATQATNATPDGETQGRGQDQQQEETVAAGEEEEDYGFCARRDAQWELVYKEGDGEAPRTSKAKLDTQRQDSESQLLEKPSRAALCYFYCTSLSYTALMLVRFGMFLALLVFAGQCVFSKMDNKESECYYVLLVASPVGGTRRTASEKTNSSHPNQTPPTRFTIPRPSPTSNTEPSPASRTASGRSSAMSGPHARSNTTPATSSPIKDPQLSRTLVGWTIASLINSLFICVFLARNAQEIQIPQRRLLLSRLMASKYFWTQLVLLAVALLYDGRFIRDEVLRAGQQGTLWSDYERMHAWVIGSRVTSALDKVFAFVVVCGFNYAKPFTIPRTRFYLKWMKTMYTLTLMIYVLDQAFSVLLDGMKVSMQAVAQSKGSRVGYIDNNDSDKAIILLLTIFSLAYRARLLEFFTDKIFYRNKDVFDIPRNTA